jgi:DNA-binding MarR family transcriptional regulator
VTQLDPASLDLPTLAALAGVAANEHLLARLRATGYEGVRTSHGYVIQVLIDGEPTVGELAAHLGVTQQAASKSVVDLERIGVVERRADTVDSRMRRVLLTEHGRALLDAGRRERRALEKRVRDISGQEDVDAAKRALAALLAVTGGSAAVARRRARPPSS